MFWGVTIENDKRYTQTVEASFHLSMAALHPTPPTGLDLKTSSTVSLWVQHDKAEFLLCTLEYGVLYQQPLDCNFTEGEEVTFFLNGQGVIHLTGYLIEDMSMADDSMEEPMMSESEDDSEESEDIPVLVDAKELSKGAKKRTKEMKMGSKKKSKVEETKDSDESSDDKSDTDDDDYEEEEDSSDEDIPEDSDDSDDENVTSKKSKKAKSTAAKNNASNSVKKPEQTKSKEQKLPEKLKNKVKKALSNSNRSADAEDSLDKVLLDASISSEKKKKKKKKKQTKASETSNEPVPNKKQESSSQIEEAKSLSRVLSSGLAIEDTQVGQGSEARIGRQVHVYYSGKLAKTGKMFDRCINGKPFRFTLGRGEVISGWEKGLAGMRVGGKRTLTVPAKLGYGSQKMGPIPPNSSLIFDIELKAIS